MGSRDTRPTATTVINQAKTPDLQFLTKKQPPQPSSVTTVLANDGIAPWRVVARCLAVAVCG
jgi:hypothetical protein